MFGSRLFRRVIRSAYCHRSAILGRQRREKVSSSSCCTPSAPSTKPASSTSASREGGLKGDSFKPGPISMHLLFCSQAQPPKPQVCFGAYFPRIKTCWQESCRHWQQVLTGCRLPFGRALETGWRVVIVMLGRRMGRCKRASGREAF